MIDGDLDWLVGYDGAPAAHDAHVWVYHGYDLTVSTGWKAVVELGACPFCEPREEQIAPVLADEQIWGGTRTIHYVACGGCGACGPWGGSESEAVRRWTKLGGRS